MRSSLTGTFGGSFFNSAANRNYVFSYTISAANTWEQKSVTIAGDTSGTWLTTSGTGIQMWWNLGSGSSNLGTAGAWGATGFYGPTGSQAVVSTSGATFYITGVQLEKGSTATSFDYRPYGTELVLCQRYFWKATQLSGSYTAFASGWGQGTTECWMYVKYPTTMRSSPTFTFNNLYAGNSSYFSSVTSFGSSGFGSDSANLVCVVSPAVAANLPFTLVANVSSTTSFLAASSEL